MSVFKYFIELLKYLITKENPDKIKTSLRVIFHLLDYLGDKYKENA